MWKKLFQRGKRGESDGDTREDITSEGMQKAQKAQKAERAVDQKQEVRFSIEYMIMY